jgi:Domain of unknown function (DUF4184)
VPFTLAHPAAVLPLRGLRYLRSVPLILGALAPDLPYFVPGTALEALLPETHSFKGSLTTDLAVAYAGLVLIFTLRVPLTALMSARGRALCLRALAPFRRNLSEWLLAPVSIVLGVWTHLAWDSFTHHDGWMVHRVALLRAPVSIGPYDGQVFHVLQYVSSVFGLAVLAIWYRRLQAPAPPQRAGAHTPRSNVGPVLALIVAAATLIGAVQATRYFIDVGALGSGTLYRTITILLTHGLTWFAILYLLGGTLATLERSHERTARLHD